MKPHVRLWLALPLGALAAGAAPLAAQDRDAVRVVARHAEAWTDATRWRLSPEPVVRIGALDGAEEEELYRVSWSGFLSDGSIVVMNAGTGELRIFDPQGRYERSFGSVGEGPGEFERAGRGVVLPGDTIVIQDRFHLEFFTPEDGFVGQVRVESSRAFPPPNLIGYTDGHFVLREGDWESRTFVFGEDGSMAGMPRVEEGVDRGAYHLIRYRRDGTLADTVAFSRSSGQTWIEVGNRGQSYSSIPHSPGQYMALGTDHFVTGFTDTNRLTFLDLDGDTLLHSELPLPRIEMTDDMWWWRFDEGYGDEPAEIRERARRSREAMPRSSHLPTFGSLVVAADGFVWVGSYSPEGISAAAPRRWFIVSPSGVYLGEVPGRPRMWVDRITDRHILGRARGAYDVEEVVVYEIVR
jgi:hypothetical protein